VYVNSGCRNLTWGIPYRFTTSYPNQEPVEQKELLTCGYCGHCTEDVVRNTRIGHSMYKDFCKNPYCCERYLKFKETSVFTPYAERENLMNQWKASPKRKISPFVRSQKNNDDMCWESNRLKSFETSWESPHVKASDLSSCGFFFLNWEDQVKCKYCGIIIGNWVENDNVWQEHLKHSPSCSFLRGKEYATNYSIRNEQFIEIVPRY
jgi:hypothetical protein